MWLLNQSNFFASICTATALVAVAEAALMTVVPDGPPCVPSGTAMQVTADCIDSQYNVISINSETDETLPVPHRKISGHVNGSTVDFNLYLPTKGWDGRFFQLVYPLQNSSADLREIGFGAESGGFTIRVNGMGGYRVDALIAKASRNLATEFYKTKRRQIYGYVYGGSGGSLTTVSAIENTKNVWQGAVPWIQAVPISNPNNFIVRALAGEVLAKSKDKIIDAVSPGGSGNPSLSSLERAAFQEASALGVPIRGWEDFEGVVRNRTDLLKVVRVSIIPTIRSRDPTYFSEHWAKVGYLGTEKSQLGAFIRSSIYEFNATIAQVTLGADNMPVSVILDKVPDTPPVHGLSFTLENGGFFTASLNKKSKTAEFFVERNATVITSLAKGTELRVSNRDTLAAMSYYRHQVPSRDGYYAWDYLRNADGTPKYPQRAVEIGPAISASASRGGTHTGKINAKVIVMSNLRDYDAYPWHADWYKNVAMKSLGAKFENNYRLYYTDNADHQLSALTKSLSSQYVDFRNHYEQHLRDLSTWVEKGVTPPEATVYTVETGQVQVPDTASARKGIQPIVKLTAQGKALVKAKTGQSVDFNAHIEVSQSTGSISSIEWDFEGTGDWVKKDFGTTRKIYDITASNKYQEKGTYYPAVRIATHRTGNSKSPYAQIQNLGRMRVVVQ